MHNKNLVLIVLLFGIVFFSGCFEERCNQLELESDVIDTTYCKQRSRVSIDNVKVFSELCNFDVVVTPEKPDPFNIDQVGKFKSCSVTEDEVKNMETTQDAIDACGDYEWKDLVERTGICRLPAVCDGEVDCCNEVCGIFSYGYTSHFDNSFGECSSLRDADSAGDFGRLDELRLTESSYDFSARKVYNEDQARAACGYDSGNFCYCRAVVYHRANWDWSRKAILNEKAVDLCDPELFLSESSE